jgi:AcrR family transcriptional regulator
MSRSWFAQWQQSAFAADGSTSMNQISQRAGVGAGTLYRNFPTRESLVLAVDTVPDLLARMPPLEALRHWTANLVEGLRRKHGLGDALGPGAHQAISEQSYGPVIAAITQLLDAGKKDGSIPPGPGTPHARAHPRRTPHAPVDAAHGTGPVK